MKNFKSLRLLPALGAIIAICAGCFAGCSTSDCDDLQNTLPMAGFFSTDSTPTPTTLPRLTLYGIGAPGDSLLLDSALAVSEAYLPFRIDSRPTSFVLDYLQGSMRDTITFTYDLSPRFSSMECGVVYDYTPTAITHTRTLIDSVTCPQGIITNVPGQNLRIYLKTSPLQ